jgi:hypothetical protein
MKLDRNIIELAIALAPWATILVITLVLIFQKELRHLLLARFPNSVKERQMRGQHSTYSNPTHRVVSPIQTQHKPRIRR